MPSVRFEPAKALAASSASCGLVAPRPPHDVLKACLRRYWESTFKELLNSSKKPELGARREVLEALSEVSKAYSLDRDAFFSCLRSSGVAPIVRAFQELEQWPKHKTAILKAAVQILPRLRAELPAQNPSSRNPHNAEKAPRRWIIQQGLWLILDDSNPLALEEAHPEKSGNQANLGSHAAEDWLKSLRFALMLIQSAWPELFEEFTILIGQIVPVGYDHQKHFSASYREAIGTIYLSLHPDPMVMATALIHEFQHNKINLASYFDPIMRNAFYPLHKSPVRPDPRPLWGILLAVHAFIPVEIFYQKLQLRQTDLIADKKFAGLLAETRVKNAEGLDTLQKHARWTPLGSALMRELRTLAWPLEKH